MELRYQKNIPALPADLDLSRSRVCVVGCGGLGGYVLELLARTGIEHLTGVDGDIFREDNLNRQLFAVEHTLGLPKVQAAAERLRAVNARLDFRPIPEFITEDNAAALLGGHDVVVDALDEIPPRRLLAAACGRLAIPLVHGAIGGWYGQVCTILPGEESLDLIYQTDEACGGTAGEQGSLSITAATVAAAQSGEVIKLLTGIAPVLSKRLLRLDLLNHDSAVIDLF